MDEKAIVSSSLKSNKLGVLFYNSLLSALAMILIYIVEHALARRHNAPIVGLESIDITDTTHDVLNRAEGRSFGW